MTLKLILLILLLINDFPNLNHQPYQLFLIFPNIIKFMLINLNLTSITYANSALTFSSSSVNF